MWVLRKRENFCREKRVAHRKQANISWWDASHSFWSLRRNLWQSLSESIGVFMTSLVQTTKTKSLLEMRGQRSIKKWALKRVRSFLISYVAWNLEVQPCKLCNNKYMIASTQRTKIKIFAFIPALIFKLLSRKVLFINRKDNRNC